MSRFHRLLGALTLALFLPPIAAAQDRDTQEIQKYVLTDAAFAKYSQATRQMAMLPGEQTGACDDAGDSLTIDETAAKFDAFPAAKSAIQATGMNTREYVVFSFALLQTGLAIWGSEQVGGTPTFSPLPANVAFWNKNQADIRKLEAVASFPDCDDEFDEEEEE